MAERVQEMLCFLPVVASSQRDSQLSHHEGRPRGTFNAQGWVRQGWEDHGMVARGS